MEYKEKAIGTIYHENPNFTCPKNKKTIQTNTTKFKKAINYVFSVKYTQDRGKYFTKSITKLKIARKPQYTKHYLNY